MSNEYVIGIANGVVRAHSINMSPEDDSYDVEWSGARELPRELFARFFATDLSKIVRPYENTIGSLNGVLLSEEAEHAVDTSSVLILHVEGGIDENASDAKAAMKPTLPSSEVVRAHNSTHEFYGNWRMLCAFGKADGARHVPRHGE